MTSRRRPLIGVDPPPSETPSSHPQPRLILPERSSFVHQLGFRTGEENRDRAVGHWCCLVTEDDASFGG